MKQIIPIPPGSTSVTIDTTAVFDTVVIPNQPPKVNAGLDQTVTLPIAEITLSAIATDPDGTIAGYLWSQVSGPSNSIIVTSTLASTKVINLVEGTYIYNIRTVDNKGAEASDTISVIVKPAIPTTGYLNLPIGVPRKLSSITGQSILNQRFVNFPAEGLYLNNCHNITIKGCFFNKGFAEAIVLENCTNITVIDCLFNNVTCGVYALNCQGVKVLNSQFVNVRKRASGHRGQFIQFNAVSGAGNEILNNIGENFPGESDPEDMISLYKSSGIQTSPILVKNNIGRGGGPSDSGGGIMSGDSGGNWQVIEDNKLLDPGNYCFAIAGGMNIIVRNNKGYQSRKPWSNVGGYAYAVKTEEGVRCSNVKFINNSIYCDSETQKTLNHYYFPTGNDPEVCTASDFSGNNSAITPALLNFPTHLITFITPQELLQIRGK